MNEDWEEPLFGCLNDLGSCLVVGLVPCGAPVIQALAVKGVTHDSILVPFALYVFLFSIGAAYNRSQIRNYYNFKVEFITDCCTHCFCSPCAVCQEYREVKFRNKRQ
mmetsp:Transcript_399/g.695  ORF Transcript_399/g.695 Transcript_399/m.695 type:complete len:107 (+) Transcript_399:1355-1675(+)